MSAAGVADPLLVRRFTRANDPHGDWEGAQAVRFEVFVAEQNVPEENELDPEDDIAHHWTLYPADVPGAKAAGTVRVYVEEDGTTAHLGRLAVTSAHRGKGYARVLVRELELFAANTLRARRIVLHAQLDKVQFYERHGYEVDDPAIFWEEGIPHKYMSKTVGA
ncbi:MAG: putative acetyltransferase [Olpidium bornovanus]|uniref:Acetyltransferase n=1 Tax=Olpidium bornovanus TaxID=278681 RepID=A0A8H7ZNM4_9FUNG|nr:MAG: putative acetyltransferase [Olpidium bornovanus]